MKRLFVIVSILVSMFTVTNMVHATDFKQVSFSVAVGTATVDAGRSRMFRIMLTNPATNYVAYDIWLSSATNGNRAGGTLIATPIVPATDYKILEFRGGLHYVNNLCVSFSTTTWNAHFDGGSDHKISIEYDD